MAKTESAKMEKAGSAQELPADPLELARRFKKVVSEDFLRSYNAVKRLVVKH